MIIVLQTKKPFKHDGKEGNVVFLEASLIRIINDDKGEPAELTGILLSGENFKYPKAFVENWSSVIRNLGGTAKKFAVVVGSEPTEEFGIIQ